MWPTLFFGTIALGLALRHAVAPKKELLPLILGIGSATIFSGWLGMTVGIMTTLRYAKDHPPPEQTTITMIGISESMQNIALALIMAILVAMATGVGSWRVRSSAAH
jgi:CDP-diglyceride synthetase